MQRKIFLPSIALLIAAFIFYFFIKTEPDTLKHAAPEAHKQANTTTPARTIDTINAPVVQAQALQQKPISEQECNDFLEKKQSSRAAKVYSNYNIIAFMKSHADHGWPLDKLIIVGDIAGLSPSQVSSAIYGLGANNIDATTTPTLMADNAAPDTNYSYKEQQVFDQLVAAKDYSALAEKFKNNEINPTLNHSFHSSLSTIIAANPKISSSDLLKLVDAGVPIQMETLVYALENHIDSDTVKLLSEHYSGDLKKNWAENDHSFNLTLAAAHQLRPDLISYFQEKDIPYTTQNMGQGLFIGQTLLDVLPTPNTPDDRQAAIKIAQQALSQNIAASLPSSAERLRGWLPEELQQTYNNQLHPENNMLDTVRETGEQLKQKITKDKKIINNIIDIENRCQKQHNLNKVDYWLNHLDTISSSQNIPLYNKLAIKEALRIKLEREVKKANADAATKKSPLNNNPQNDIYSRFTNALISRHYDEAFSLAEQIEQAGSPNIYNTFFSLAISTKAPNSVFQDLFARGVQAPENLILEIAVTNNIELAKMSLEHGANLNAVDYFGENALSKCISYGKDKSMFLFLLNAGASVKPSTIGPDPLDTALSEMDGMNVKMLTDPNFKDIPYINADPAFFAAELIKHGAPIEQSHRDKIAILKIINPTAVTYLQSMIPNMPL